MDVGKIRIDPVIDTIRTLTDPAAERLFRLASDGGSPALEERLAMWAPHAGLLDETGHLRIAIGGFLVRTDDRVVVVDTGGGKPSADEADAGRFLANLARLRVRPEEVTDVVFTHLHWDHVGWASADGQPTFANATYRCSPLDWEHFMAPYLAGRAEHDPRVTGPLAPIEERLTPFPETGPLLPGIDLMPAPGHTPGSTVLVLSSGNDRAMLLGDVVHCPVQLLEDDWTGIRDVDPELARRTRVLLAREIEGQDIPVAAGHFPDLLFGRLLRGEGKRRWVNEGAIGAAG